MWLHCLFDLYTFFVSTGAGYIITQHMFSTPMVPACLINHKHAHVALGVQQPVNPNFG